MLRNQKILITQEGELDVIQKLKFFKKKSSYLGNKFLKQIPINKNQEIQQTLTGLLNKQTSVLVREDFHFSRSM